MPVAMTWAILLPIAGGFGTGLLIMKFSMLGAAGVWAVGALGGFVARKITGSACPLVAVVLCVGCFVALALAETSWYHWSYDIPDPITGAMRPMTWAESITRIPKFMWDRVAAGLGVGILFAVLGAQSAYWQVGRN